MKYALILCSGGLDSVTTAHYVKAKGSYSNLTLLFFSYGQAALSAERACAQQCASDIGATFREIDFSWLKELSASALTRDAVAEHQSGLKNTEEESAQWYVPMRNLAFLSYALSFADALYVKEQIESDIFVGFKHEGEEHYPDTTPEFVSSVNAVASSCKTSCSVHAPLIDKNKEDIVLIARELGIDYQKTFSCYSDGSTHCGACLACRLRHAGFYWAGVGDPTKYKATPRDVGKKTIS